MQDFRVKDNDKWMLLGCLNTTLILAESNIYNLQNKKEELRQPEKEALTRLQYEKNSIELLKAKLLETMPKLGLEVLEV